MQNNKINSLNFKNNKFLKLTVFLFPIVFISLLILHKIMFGPGNISYFTFLDEDGPVEYATVMFSFLSVFLSTIVAINFIKIKKKTFALLYFVLSASLFFVGFEEISWGQRVFLEDTPEFFSGNLQNEMTFHNLPKIQNIVFLGYFLVGIFGSFFWIFISKLKKSKYKNLAKAIIPQRFLMSYFVPIFLFVGMLSIRSFRIITPDELWFDMFHWRDMEAIEFILAIGIFLFVLSKILEFKTNIPACK